MARLQVQDIGKKANYVTSCSGVLLKPVFVSARYTRLGYIHLTFKGRREISNSLALSEIKKSLQINTATPNWINNTSKWKHVVQYKTPCIK